MTRVFTAFEDYLVDLSEIKAITGVHASGTAEERTYSFLFQVGDYSYFVDKCGKNALQECENSRKTLIELLDSYCCCRFV